MVKEMVAILFPATKNIDEVVGIIEKYRMKFGLDTGLRLAQFLAQVREEVGPEFKVIRENLNYKKETALKLFKNMTAADARQSYDAEKLSTTFAIMSKQKELAKEPEKKILFAAALMEIVEEVN